MKTISDERVRRAQRKAPNGRWPKTASQKSVKVDFIRDFIEGYYSHVPSSIEQGFSKYEIVNSIIVLNDLPCCWNVYKTINYHQG